MARKKLNTEQKLSVARKALRQIAPVRECENYTSGIGECFRNGRTPTAEFGADRCCGSCIAWQALDRIAGRTGLEFKRR